MVATRISDCYISPTEFQNTEEVCRGIQDVNKILADVDKEEEIVIGSMDAVGLYPSLKIEETVGICLDIKFEGVDWQEMVKYIKVSLTETEIKEAGLDKFMPDKFMPEIYTSRKTKIKNTECQEGSAMNVNLKIQ